MGATDIKVGEGFDKEKAMYDRNNRLHKPEFEPSLSSEDGSMDNSFGGGDPFGSSDPFGGGDSFGSGGSSFGGGDPFGSSDPFGGGNPFGGSGNDPFGMGGNGMATPGFSPMGSGFGMQTPMAQQQTEEKSSEDKFFDAVVTGAKKTGGMIKDILSSFKGLTPLYWTRFGLKSAVVGLVLLGVGLLLRVFGLKFGFSVAIGGALTAGIGLFVQLFNTENARNYTEEYKNLGESTDSTTDVGGFEDFSGSSSDFGSSSDDFGDFGDFGDSSDSSGGNDDFGDTSDGDDFAVDDSDDEFEVDNSDSSDDSDDEFEILNTADDSKSLEDSDVDSALDSTPVMDKGMYTRQYLYDAFTKILPTINPDFQKVKEYKETDETFLKWDSLVHDAAELLNIPAELQPNLISLKENIFTITAVVSRNAKFTKPREFANELATAYAHSVYADRDDQAKVFAKFETVMKTCEITIFLGNTIMVSLMDTYKKVGNFILDSHNTMPIILGVDEHGDIKTLDMKYVESMIIAGMPRSGKSWFVQAVLTQMCAFCSPKDLNLYILDPKAGTSDYNKFTLPHVKMFASKYVDANGTVVNEGLKGILDVLRYVADVEAPRRKKILGDAGCVNINDFRSKYPDVDMPYIYIVIDEMVTLSSMEKEQEKEYQTDLRNIVTQFPNLGIRGIFIPHEVKNQIIDKTAYDSIKSRISVKGSPEHIEASTGTKVRDFPYKLTNTGDMAVNIDRLSPATLFVHGVVLTKSNDENNKIFDFLRRFWGKLEPDELKNSVAYGVDEIATGQLQAKEALNSADDDEEFDLFDDD